MDTILIVCGAGASSTFLASRMRSLAAARRLPVTVEAISQQDIARRLPSASVLLVGPHLEPEFDSFNAQAHDLGISAVLLSADVFGAAGAETALNLASGLLTAGQSISHPQTEGIPHG